MKTNLLKTALLALGVMMCGSAWADGVQSVKVTFNGTDNANWVAANSGSIATPVNGVATVTMALQSGSTKYRADLQYNTASTYTFDKTKDIVWAVKLIEALPGTANTKKFELQYKNSSNANTWINGINSPSGTITCTDGGVIYYYNLGSDGLNKLSGVQDGTVSISQIHFIFADATELTAETAKYSVDWVGTFASVADLTSAKDWKDDYQDYTENIVNLNKLDVNNAAGYDAFSNAVSGATANDVLLVKGNVTATDKVTIDKAITLQTLSDCSVSNAIEVNGGDLTLNGASVKSIKVVNNTVKLTGNNTVTDGITLNKGKRITDSGATNTTPIKITLASDYQDYCAVVLTCSNADLFTLTNEKKLLCNSKSGSTNEVKVMPTSYTLTIGQYGASTLILPFTAEIPSGVKAYTLNYTSGNDKVKATEVTGDLTYNTPVLINAAQGDYTFTMKGTDKGITNATIGALTGCLSSNNTNVPEESYILFADDTHPVCFYKGTGNKISANRAYLTADGAGAKTGSFLGIDFGSATAINGVNATDNVKVANGKYIKNGKFVIIKNGAEYNAAGAQMK